MKRVSILASCAVFCVVSISQGALAPDTGEYPLLGDIDGHQQNPCVAVGVTGGFVVWQNATDSSKGERILAQRLGADFRGMGSPVVVSQNMAGSNDINPRVSMLPEGGAVVTWESGPRASTDVYVRFLDMHGNLLGGAQRVNTHASGIQSDADVATLASGQTLVVWTSLGQDGDGEGIYGQRFTSQGVRDGAEFLINQTTARNQSKSSAAALNGDKFVVGWISESSNGRNSSGAPNLRANVMARHYNSIGVALGNEYRLNDGDIVSSEVQIASASEGFVAAWVQQDEANMNNLSDVFVKSFDANGLPTAQSALHNTYLKGRQEDPGIAVIGEDAFVAWTSYGQDAGGAGIQGRLISGGTEFAINSQGNLHQKGPAIASYGENKYLAVWVNTIAADHSIISAKRYSLRNGATVEGVVDVTAGVVQVVAADFGPRKTNPQAASAQVVATTGQQPVATLNINPAPPQVSSVAPAVAAVRQQQQTGSAPQVITTSSPSPAPVITTTQPSQRVSQAAATAMNSMAQLRASPNTYTRMNTRQPQLRSSTMAAQSSLQQQARSRMYGTAVNRPAYQSQNSAFNRAKPTANSLMSPTRTAFLRQPLQASAMNRGSYSRMSTRGIQRPVSSASATTGSGVRSVRQLTPNTGSQAGRTAGYQRMNTRQSSTAADRFGSLMNRAQASAADARNSGMRPVPASVTQNGRGTRLQWLSQNGARYQVQSSNDRTSWQNVGTPRSGRAGSDSMPVQPGGPRYYRVVRSN
jgi:hypothetical protein